MEVFYATVTKVYGDDKSFEGINLDTQFDPTPIYENKKNFSKIDTRRLGSVDFTSESNIQLQGHAYPYEKNILVFPIVGETIIIHKVDNWFYYLPYPNTLYANFRESPNISKITTKLETKDVEPKLDAYRGAKQGTPNQTPIQKTSDTNGYKKKPDIHFLKPRTGDTVFIGRTGQSIRFSEFFLSTDGKESSPSIFIRTKQSEKSKNKPIGELVDEDINDDGSSIYLVSEKVKVPYKKVVQKSLKATDSSIISDEKNKGNQIYINSGRLVLSAKETDTIILAKQNVAILSDRKFSVDAESSIGCHTSGDITLHTQGKKIFLNSDGGKVYLGKDVGEGAAGAAVQKMVLGGELVKILSELIDTINQQYYLTPAGSTAPNAGPENRADFNSIKRKLNNILSEKNFLSKN